MHKKPESVRGWILEGKSMDIVLVGEIQSGLVLEGKFMTWTGKRTQGDGDSMGQLLVWTS